MKNIHRLNLLLAFSAMVLLLFGSVMETNSQTRRNNRRATPVPTPTPIVRQLTVPEIISQADQNLPPIVVTENTEPSVENAESETEQLNSQIKALNSRIKTLESGQKPSTEEKEKRLLLNLDILTRAEQRVETLRKQLFELIEKENSVKSKIEELNYNMRPEVIDRTLAFSGSLRPEDAREARRKSLESEKNNMTNLLTQIETNRATLEQSVQKADFMVEKIRAKFEKEIDEALVEGTEQP